MSQNDVKELRSERDYMGWVTPLLAGLSIRHRAAFAAAVAEKQFGTYAYLARNEASLKPHILRLALDRVWAYVADETIGTAMLVEAQEMVEPLIPNLDDPDAPGDAALVLDAVGAGSYAIQSCLSGSISSARAAGVTAISAVHDWVDGLLRPGLSIAGPGESRIVQQNIDHHPMMVRELAHIRQVMGFLIEQPRIDEAVCLQLRALWPNGGKSNLDSE